MSTLRVNQVYLNDAGNATVSIANSWNVAVISGGQTRLHVNYDGNIGMGTTTPSYKVHMVNSGTAAYVAAADGSGTTLSGVNGSGLGVYGTFSATDTAIFSNSIERVRVAATGNVGIGTSTPGYMLDVAGTINTANLLVNGVVPVSIPTGAVVNYASTTAPTGGYLPCDGSIYSRSTYTALADVIGTPPMLSSFTAEYSNSNAQWLSSQIAVANGVAFISNANPVSTSVNPQGQYSGGLYTSTDGSTWTPRTARSFYFNQLIPNGSVVANASGSVWMIANTFSGSTTTYNYQQTPATPIASATLFQTSTDLATWTSRSISLGGTQTGLPTVIGVGAANPFVSFNGLAGGGTSNRFVALFSRYSNNCCGSSAYIANTATSDDSGATWSFTNNIPIANSAVISAIASSNGGFVIVRGNTAYWSYSGQTWQDISANLVVALGSSVTANIVTRNTLLFYNVYQANNQFIIPAYGNKFLVSSPSGNGANGNWSTLTPEGLPSTSYYAVNLSTSPSALIPHPIIFYYWGTNYFASSIYRVARIVHNGQCFVLSQYGQIFFSRDLQYWFRDTDVNYTNETQQASFYGDGSNLAALGNKFLLNLYSMQTVVSFTANSAYTAATQFPVPKYSSSVQAQLFNLNGVPAIPSIPYIKT